MSLLSTEPTAVVLQGPQLGPLQLSSPFILAPMAGLTNWPFRRLVLEAGAGLTVTEMASSVALSHRGPATLRLLKTDPSLERPFCVQIFGRDPERMALAAQVAEEQGADLVDLNLGCPARKVVSSGHGAALLKNFDLAEKIVRAVVAAVRIPVTVKTRPGFSPEDGSIFELWPRLADAGVAAITLHPRFASAGFSGEADWSLVARLAEEASVPVIGSGDVVTAEQALDYLARYGVAAVMIGRAARGRPWLFRQCKDLWQGREIREPDLNERLNIAVRHARLMETEFGPVAAFRLRTVLMWYTRELPGAAALRAELCREENIDRQMEILERGFRRADTFLTDE